MKRLYSGIFLAALLLVSAARAHASANDWIRYQEATDPGYNQQARYDSYEYDGQYDDNSYDSNGPYDSSYHHYSDSPDIRYCQDGLWVSTDQDCPEVQRTEERSSDGRHYTIFTFIYRYFGR